MPKSELAIPERNYISARVSSANRFAVARGRNLVRYSIGKIPYEDMYLKMRLQNYACMYCKDTISFNTCQIDHIYPVSKGGEHFLYNIALTCSTCNKHKGMRTLKRFCQIMKFDYEAIIQEIAEINHQLHIQIFGEDYTYEESDSAD